MSVRCATTCSQKGYAEYGYRLRDSWHLWKGAELYWYTEEGYDPSGPGIKCIDSLTLQNLQKFKSRYAHYEPRSYLYDVVRFSHKVFAAIDAFRDHDGLGVWVDADCVLFNELTEDLVRSQIPRGHYMSVYKRPGLYTETGLWIMDCSHPQHLEFLQTWEDWYTSDFFKNLDNWTDCETLDATIRRFERHGLIKTHDLSGGHGKAMHPQAKSVLGGYIDHCKGPKRKLDGKSPENERR